MKKTPTSTEELIALTGMTQTELADRIGCRQATISQTLSGRSTSKRICDAIDRFAAVPNGTTKTLAKEVAKVRQYCRQVRRKAIQSNMAK